MKILVNQQELNQMVQDHLTNQGITLNNKEIHFDYTDGVEITLGQVSKPKRKPKENKPIETVEEPDTEDTTETEELSQEPEKTAEEVNEEIPFSKTSRPLFT